MSRSLAAGALVLFAGFGCTADLVKTELDDPATMTIGMSTGVGADDKVYESAFRKGAVKACGGAYTVVERSRRPWTLDGYKLDPSHFYWVITCGANGSEESAD